MINTETNTDTNYKKKIFFSLFLGQFICFKHTGQNHSIQKKHNETPLTHTDIEEFIFDPFLFGKKKCIFCIYCVCVCVRAYMQAHMHTSMCTCSTHTALV